MAASKNLLRSHSPFLQNRSWNRWDPNPKIKDPIVKKHWDTTKTPAQNLRDMGLVVQPNQLHHHETAERKEDGKPVVVELFDVPISNKPTFREKFPLSKEDEVYMAKCLAKWGDNFEGMFRDTETNDMQHTESKLRKMGMQYLSMTPEQRRVEVPEKVEELVATYEGTSVL